MAHVKVKYVEEVYDQDFGGSYPVWKVLEGTYKRVIWDGNSLIVGNRKIITKEISTYGTNDIEYLEIDGEVYRDIRPETLQKDKEEHEKRLARFQEWITSHETQKA